MGYSSKEEPFDDGVYNYAEAEFNDVLEYVTDNYSLNDWVGRRDELEETLNDELWAEDSITGNASRGGYEPNLYKVEDYLNHNWDLLKDALDDFGEKMEFKENWQYDADATIRCHLLGSVISDVLDSLGIENC